MDPKAAVRDLLVALMDGNREAAWDALEALVDWTSRRHGFLPSPADVKAICREIADRPT